MYLFENTQVFKNVVKLKNISPKNLLTTVRQQLVDSWPSVDQLSAYSFSILKEKRWPTVS